MKFLKQILRPGKYLVSTLDGQRKEETFSRDRIKRIAATAAKMMEDADPAKRLSIPAPWRHDKSAPFSSREKLRLGAKSNAGYWEKIYQDVDGSLVGVFDCPIATDAEKVGKTVREVSPLIKPKWKDGLGREWADALLHVALVTNPIQPGQSNFKPLAPEAVSAEKDEYAVAMSALIELDLTGPEDEDDDETDMDDLDEEQASALAAADDPQPVVKKATGATIADIIKILAKVGLRLPDDTTPENLVERIAVAGIAVGEQQAQDDPEEKLHEESPTPIAMGEDMPDTQDNPYIQIASDAVKGRYATRITALLGSGRITPAYKKKTLDPLLEGFQLSLDDESHEPNRGPLDDILDALEGLPQGASGFTPPAAKNGKAKTRTAGGWGRSGGTQATESALALEEEELPDEGTGVAAEDSPEVEQAADEQLRNTGRLPRNRLPRESRNDPAQE